MKIELRKVAYSARLSEETANFAADIWIDGKLRGQARNQGTGGATFVTPHALAAELEAYALTLPKGKYGPESAESVIDGAFNAWQQASDLKKLLSKKAVLLNDKNQIMAASVKPTPEVLARFEAKHPGKLLNTMPFEKALELYLAHG